MSWVKVDDHFDEHPKMARVGPLGWGVWLAGLAYSNRNLTDGFIPIEVAEAIGGRWRVRCDGLVWNLCRTSGADGEDMTSEWVTDLLIDAGLWEVAEDGYRIHDYAQYQPTRADADARADDIRAKRAAAGKAGGLRSGASKRAANQLDAEANAKQTRSKREANAKQTRSPDPDPDPDPDPLPEAPSTPRPPQAGEADPRRSDPDIDPEDLPLEQRVLLAIQQGPADPLHATARKLADRHADLIRAIGLSPPRWTAAGPCYVRALLWLRRELQSEGWNGDALDEAGFRLAAAIKAASRRDFGPGCGGDIHAFRSLFGSGERNVAERVGALLTLVPHAMTDRHEPSPEAAP